MECACDQLYCHLWPVRLYHFFPHYLKRHNSQKKLTDRKMCVQMLSKKFSIPRRIKRNVITVNTGLHAKNLLFLSDFNDNSVFWQFFFFKSSNTQFHGYPSGGHKDGQTDTQTERHDEANSSFHNFAISSKILQVYLSL
jgi:hypothetical protein